MAKDSKKPKGEKNLHCYYIELDSPFDFARQAFSPGRDHIKAVKKGDKYMLLAGGEKFEHVRILYYTTVDKIGNFFVYDPGFDSIENFEVKDTISYEHSDYKSFRAPIIVLPTVPYDEIKDFEKAGKIEKMEIKDPYSLVRVVAGMHDDEYSPRLYAFYNGKDHIIGTFDLFHEGTRIFAYSKIDMNDKFSAFSYNYMNDSIAPVNSYTEKSVVYIKVINLKKPFPFF